MKKISGSEQELKLLEGKERKAIRIHYGNTPLRSYISLSFAYVDETDLEGSCFSSFDNDLAFYDFDHDGCVNDATNLSIQYSSDGGWTYCALRVGGSEILEIHPDQLLAMSRTLLDISSKLYVTDLVCDPEQTQYEKASDYILAVVEALGIESYYIHTQKDYAIADKDDYLYKLADQVEVTTYSHNIADLKNDLEAVDKATKRLIEVNK